MTPLGILLVSGWHTVVSRAPEHTLLSWPLTDGVSWGAPWLNSEEREWWNYVKEEKADKPQNSWGNKKKTSKKLHLSIFRHHIIIVKSNVIFQNPPRISGQATSVSYRDIFLMPCQSVATGRNSGNEAICTGKNFFWLLRQSSRDLSELNIWHYVKCRDVSLSVQQTKLSQLATIRWIVMTF